MLRTVVELMSSTQLATPTTQQEHHLPDTLTAPQELDRVERYILKETFLKLSVLDTSIEEDGVLIVAIDASVPASFVKQSLQRVWSGAIEVYCPMDMMTGNRGAVVA